MRRTALPALLTLLFSACGPDTAERGDFYSSQPFYNPLRQVTVAGTEAGGLDGGAAQGASTASVAGASAEDAGVPPRLNQAERVWKSQADVWATGEQLKKNWGEPALSWLRLARSVASAPVTAGVIAEQPDGTWRYASGGTTLRMVTKDGWRGELRVDALVGDLSAQYFPRDREGLDATWLHPNGTSLRCLLEYQLARFTGWAPDDEGLLTRLTVSRRTVVRGSSGPDTLGNWATISIVEGVDTGEVTWPGARTVRFLTETSAGSCIGSCTGGVGTYAFREHETSVEFLGDGQRWSLAYEDGWDKSSETGVTKHLWRGVISGPTPGQLVITPSNSVFRLDVEIGGERYTTQAVLSLLE